MELVKADVKINRLNGRNAINSYIGIFVTYFLTIAILVLTFIISKVPGISIPWYVFLIIIALGGIAVVIASAIDFIYIIKFINTSVNQIRNKLKEENNI